MRTDELAMLLFERHISHPGLSYMGGPRKSDFDLADEWGLEDVLGEDASGSRGLKSAMQKLARGDGRFSEAEAPPRKVVGYRAIEAVGDGEQLLGGNNCVLDGGDRSVVAAGWCSRISVDSEGVAVGGELSHCISNRRGMSITGRDGLSISGVDGTAAAGVGGTIAIDSGLGYVFGRIDGDKLHPDTLYRLHDGKFVEAERKLWEVESDFVLPFGSVYGCEKPKPDYSPEIEDALEFGFLKTTRFPLDQDKEARSFAQKLANETGRSVGLARMDRMPDPSGDPTSNKYYQVFLLLNDPKHRRGRDALCEVISPHGRVDPIQPRSLFERKHGEA